MILTGNNRYINFTDSTPDTLDFPVSEADRISSLHNMLATL